MTKHEQILAALETLLRGITESNGFSCNAGDKVWRNLEYQSQPPEKPCLILYPQTVTDSLGGETPPSQGEENHFLPIEIEGFITDDERGSCAEGLRGDIAKAIKSDTYLGGLTEGFESSITSEARTENAGKDGFLGFVLVKFTILYVTLYGES